MSLTADPRWIEHRDAYRDVSGGLNAPPGAHERYRQSLLPYVQFLAEITPEHVRKHMMQALVNDEEGISFGIVAAGFRATKEEGDFLREHPPIQAEPVDEIDRLQRLPYSAYLKTEHWQRVREEALKRYDNRCQICNRTDRLEVHHRTYSRKGCERPMDVGVLCHECHTRHHGAMREVS